MYYHLHKSRKSDKLKQTNCLSVTVYLTINIYKVEFYNYKPIILTGNSVNSNYFNACLEYIEGNKQDYISILL